MGESQRSPRTRPKPEARQAPPSPRPSPRGDPVRLQPGQEVNGTAQTPGEGTGVEERTRDGSGVA